MKLIDTRTGRELREEIENRLGRATVWVDGERIEAIEWGLTPEWALRGHPVSVSVEVDMLDESEDWWPGVESRIIDARRAFEEVENE